MGRCVNAPNGLPTKVRDGIRGPRPPEAQPVRPTSGGLSHRARMVDRCSALPVRSDHACSEPQTEPRVPTVSAHGDATTRPAAARRAFPLRLRRPPRRAASRRRGRMNCAEFARGRRPPPPTALARCGLPNRVRDGFEPATSRTTTRAVAMPSGLWRVVERCWLSSVRSDHAG